MSNTNALNRVHKITATFEIPFEFEVSARQRDFHEHCEEMAWKMFYRFLKKDSVEIHDFNKAVKHVFNRENITVRIEELE